MTIKGFDYLVADNQVHEQFHESLEDGAGRPRFLVFCDAISAADSLAMTRSSQAAATLAEQALTEFLEAKDSIDEDCLQEAFTHANERLLELYGDDRQGVAVSALVMLLQASADTEQPDSFLIAGVGDTRAYRINRDEADLVFADPHTPDISTALGPEERSLALTNALGLGAQVRVTTRHVLQTPFQRYLLMTYGAYAQLSTQSIHQLGLHPHDPIHGVAAVLKRKHTHSHLVRICTATYEQFPGVQITEETKMLESEPNNDTAPRRKRSAALAIGGAAAALALTIGLQLGSSSGDQDSDSTLAAAAETQELKTALAREQSLRARVQDQLTQTRQELDQLVTKVGQDATSVAASDEAGASAETQDELKRLRREKRMLAAQLDALKRRVNKQGDEQSRGQVSLGGTQQQGMDADESALAARLDDVTQEYSDLQSKYNQMRDEFAQKMGSLQSSYEQERRRNEQLQADITRGTAQSRGQVNLAEEARTAEKMHQLSMELSNTRVANQQLEQQVTQQKAQIALLEKRFADGRATTGQRVLEAKAEVAQESAHLEDVLKEAQGRIEELEEALVQERGRPRGTRSQRAQISKLRTELSKLKKAQKNGTVAAELTAEKEALAAQLDQVRTAFLKEQQEATFLRAQLDRVDSTDQMVAATDSQAQVEELTAKVDQLSSAFAAEQQQSANLRLQLRNVQEQASLERTPQAQRQVAELTEQIGELTAALNQEQLQTRHLREEVSSLRGEVREDMTPQLIELQAVVAAEQARNSELEAELASMTQTASERVNQLKSAYASAKARAETAESSSAELGEALARNQELQSERLKLLQDKATLMEGIAKLNEMQTLYQEERERRVTAEQALSQAQTQAQAQALQAQAQIQQAQQDAATAMARQTVINNASRSLAMNDTLYAGGSRVHTVQRGETLSGISVKYFDTVTRASDIFEANRDVLPNKNQIRVGMQLVIPDAD